MSNAAEQQYAEQGIVYLDPKMRIKNYWTQRSHSFAELRVRELNSVMADRWLREIAKHIPAGGQLRILDIGTGPGFFSIILAEAGYQVTAVDYTAAMLEEAKKNAGALAQRITYCQMDASHLAFVDETFDAVVSRNLTWNLEDPEQAYKEWMRVLKPGGVLLNFDANYGAVDFTDTSDLPKNHAHNQIENTLMQECEDIKRQLSISNYARPAWDLEALSNSGVQQFQIDVGVSQRVYMEKNAFYNPTPLFAVCGKKGDL